MKSAARKTSVILTEPANRIRIKKSNNKLKLPVARVISEWLDAPDRTWGFNGSVDKNVERILGYLQTMFPDYSWYRTASQKPFDIVSPDAKVAIEIKSVLYGNTRIITNASIYPDYVKVKDVKTKSLSKAFAKLSDDEILDVLVVCVSRNTDNKVVDFAIVDGAYWNITYEDYKACSSLYNTMNNGKIMHYILKALSKVSSTASFIKKLTDGAYGAGCELNFRTLVSLTNPVGRLNLSGWWG